MLMHIRLSRAARKTFQMFKKGKVPRRIRSQMRRKAIDGSRLRIVCRQIGIPLSKTSSTWWIQTAQPSWLISHSKGRYRMRSPWCPCDHNPKLVIGCLARRWREEQLLGPMSRDWVEVIGRLRWVMVERMRMKMLWILAGIERRKWLLVLEKMLWVGHRGIKVRRCEQLELVITRDWVQVAGPQIS